MSYFVTRDILSSPSRPISSHPISSRASPPHFIPFSLVTFHPSSSTLIPAQGYFNSSRFIPSPIISYRPMSTRTVRPSWCYLIIAPALIPPNPPLSHMTPFYPISFHSVPLPFHISAFLALMRVPSSCCVIPYYTTASQLVSPFISQLPQP